MRNGRIYLYPGSGRFTKGTWDDLREAAMTPVEGLHLAFYDDDPDEDGRPGALLFEGVVHEEPDGRWVAIMERSGFRHESDEN